MALVTGTEWPSGSILDYPPQALFESFLAGCAAVGIDADQVRRMAEEMRAFERESDRHLHAPDPLEQRWYDSLERGEPDYGVYECDEYMAEAWQCWRVYSRKYLRSLMFDSVASGKPLAQRLAPRRIVDLGCGIGYSTAGLAELWPNAEVVGTNLGDTKQVAFAKRLASEHRFRVETQGLGHVGKADLVFASEYFEHFQEPLSHLREVMGYLKPSVMVIANAFTNRSTGHFHSYRIDGQEFSGRQTSRKFNAHLAASGMRKLSTSFWNGRPAIWIRTQSSK